MTTSMSKDGLVTIPINASDAYHMGYAQGYADGRSTAPRWVRCEEEMPNVGENVLAWEYGQFAIVDKYCGDGKWGLSDALARYSHWMPLPDSPGGEK